jgi:hypothetical protein
MAVAYNPTPINWSQLNSIGANIGEGYRNNQMRNVGIGPNGEIDFKALWQADPQMALKYKIANDENEALAAYRRATQENKDRPTPTDRKAMREARKDLTTSNNLVTNLKEAEALLNEGGEGKGVYEGYGADIAADIGTKLPFGMSEWLGKKGLIDTKKAQRSQEYANIVSPEAMQFMAEQLKGSTAYQELMHFQRIYADPTVTNKTKASLLGRLIRATESTMAANQQTVSEVEGDLAAPATDGEFADEGEEVEGPDGKTYVVRGGELVPQ